MREPARLCLAALLVPVLLTGCGGGILDPRGPVGAAERQIMLNALAIMLAIVVPTILAALAFAWWFRASNPRARRRPQWSYSGRIELIVWSIPLLAIVFLGGLTWRGSHELDPARPLASPLPPLEVQVVSLDWKWLFIYPGQGVATVNQLYVPTGVPLHLSLTSASVMNSFFVPQLGSMIATMNGMVTQLHLQADQPGDYYGQSTQFSGDGFAEMNFLVHALPAPEFDDWVKATRAGGSTLDRAAYERLSRQSRGVAPSAYAAVDPHLFHALVTQEIPPSDGPVTGHAGATAHPAARN